MNDAHLPTTRLPLDAAPAEAPSMIPCQGETAMPVGTFPAVRTGDTPVDFWTLLTGGSIGMLAGFAIDLLRLCLYRTQQSLAGVWRLASVALPVTGRSPANKHAARCAAHRSQGRSRRWLVCTGTAAR